MRAMQAQMKQRRRDLGVPERPDPPPSAEPGSKPDVDPGSKDGMESGSKQGSEEEEQEEEEGGAGGGVGKEGGGDARDVWRERHEEAARETKRKGLGRSRVVAEVRGG